MIEPIVSSPSPITLIGGAQVAPDTLTVALKWGNTVACADGGADTALWAELDPVAIIGDMDSISQAAKTAYRDILHPIAEQDSTDFDKALRHIEAPLILGVGFLGDRLDHALAAIHVLLKYRDRPVVLIGDHDLMFICPAEIEMSVPKGMRVSLMPVPDAGVETRGLTWDVSDAAMSMRAFIGTSNAVASSPVTIRATGDLAVLMPPEALDAVVAALTDAFHAQ